MLTHSYIFAWRIHGQRSLVGYSQEGCKESDMTEQISMNYYPWSTNGHIRGRAGKFLGGIRHLLDGQLKGPSFLALS